MTYIERSRITAPCVETTNGGLRSASARVLRSIIAWPVRAWRNSRDLHEISRLSREELSNIGLTPADVLAARCLPFHVGATVVLTHLEGRRSSAGPAEIVRQAAIARRAP
jgi:uncharacterized protein YjiS (DUF1127 family)